MDQIFLHDNCIQGLPICDLSDIIKLSFAMKCFITYTITVLIALLNNMQSALGSTETTGDNIFHSSETS